MSRRIECFSFCVALLACIPSARVAHGQTKLYWTDQGGNSIQRSELDGSNLETLVSTPDSRGLALDLLNNRMYWTNRGDNLIQRSDLDGNSVQNISPSGTTLPLAIAVNPAGGKIYWVESTPVTVKRANLDGTSPDTLADSGIGWADGIIVDAGAGKLYWSDWPQHRIQRSSMDGTGLVDLVTGLDNPFFLGLDEVAGKLYWNDWSSGPIQRSNIDGTAVDNLIASGLSNPTGFAIDPPGGKFYWTDGSPASVLAANLDGSGMVTIRSTGFTRPWAISVRRPSLQGCCLPNGTCADLTASACSSQSGTPQGAGTTCAGLPNADGDASPDACEQCDNDPAKILPGICGCGTPDADSDSDGVMNCFDVCPGANDTTDCNTNSTPDCIELAQGSSRDCNTNGRLDECDLLVLGPTAMYWTEATTDRIQRSGLDGGNVQTIISTTDSEGLALDAVARKIYWPDRDVNKIFRANLDGTGIETLIDVGLNGAFSITLDLAGGRMYWTEKPGAKIVRANLDGSNIQPLITSGLSDEPYGISLDVAASRMYWTDHNNHTVQRANLDGSGIQDLATGLAKPFGLALDLPSSKMYWGNWNGGPIQRSSLDGSNIDTLITTGVPLPLGIGLDLSASRLYWVDYNDGAVRRSGLDGSTVQTLVTGLSNPWGFALLTGAASADCNTNAIPDECDIAAGTSTDCNTNRRPDECDISLGASTDCNTSGLPDECDIASGTSADCNANSRPDECDIAGGTSGDCNTDRIPDECDLASGTSRDCNANQRPDECDLAGGTSRDCNTNTLPDECDLAGGTSPDCNSNGIPDTCDVAAGTSPDCDGNAQPDDCQAGFGTYTWTGANGGDFSTPANWQPASMPGPVSTVQLTNTTATDNRSLLNASGDTTLCSLAVSASGAGRQILEIGPNARLRCHSGSTLAPGGEVNLQGGELTGGTVTNQSNTIRGFGKISASVINQGTLEGETGMVLTLTGASVENRATATFRVPIAAVARAQSTTLIQAGLIEVQSLGAFVATSTLTNSAGGLIRLWNGTIGAAGLTNQPGAVITGFGTMQTSVVNNGDILTIADTQVIGNLTNAGTITIQSGVFTVTGSLSGNGTIIGGFGGRDGDPRDNGFTVLGDYHVDPGGSLILDNATIRLGGDWDVAIDNPDRFDMTTSTLQLIGLPQNAPQDIEVMGEDIGGCGLVFPRRDLFSFRKFRIGPTATGARLVDNHINATGGIGREAMYVSQLVLEAGTSLDVAGLWLYYETVTPADPFAPNSGVRIIDSVGGGGIMSAATTAPEITVSPVSQSTCAGGSMTLTVTANGAPPLNYQWRKNGVLISGASDTTYTINPATAEDFGVYDVIVFNNCGLSISDSAVVEVWAAEPGDINGDTAINGLDIASFVTALQVHPNGPASLEFCSADMDHSGVIDGADVPLMVAVLLGP